MSYTPTVWVTGDIVTQAKANNWEAQYSGVFDTSAKTATAPWTFQFAVAAVSADGLVLATTTPATVGAQKYSPRMRMRGFGWKTDATAASQAVDFAFEVRPVQGAAAPTGNLVWGSAINGGSYSDLMSLSSGAFLGINPGATVENLLHVRALSSVVSQAQITAEGGSGGYGAGIAFASRTSVGGALVTMAKITGDGESSWNTTASTQDAGLRFFTAADGALAEAARMTSDLALQVFGQNFYVKPAAGSANARIARATTSDYASLFWQTASTNEWEAFINTGSTPTWNLYSHDSAATTLTMTTTGEMSLPVATAKFGVGIATPTVTGDFRSAVAGSATRVRSYNSDNANTASSAIVGALVGGSAGGDPIFYSGITSVGNWNWGAANADSDKWKLSWDSTGSTPNGSQGTAIITATTAGDITGVTGSTWAVTNGTFSGGGGSLTLNTGSSQVMSFTTNNVLKTRMQTSGTWTFYTGTVQLAGTTSSELALVRSGTTLLVRVGDDTADADLRARVLSVSSVGTATTRLISNGAGLLQVDDLASHGFEINMLTDSTFWVRTRASADSATIKANIHVATGYFAYGTNPAQTGFIRAGNAQYWYSRNNANGADIQVLGVNASDKIAFDPGGTGITFGSSGVQVLTAAGKIQALTTTYFASLSFDASNLTGTCAAINGAAITNLAAANLTGTISSARLGTIFTSNTTQTDGTYTAAADLFVIAQTNYAGVATVDVGGRHAEANGSGVAAQNAAMFCAKGESYTLASNGGAPNANFYIVYTGN